MIIKKIFSLLACSLLTVAAEAQIFDNYFENRTLRLDYNFAGTNREQTISLDELCQSEGWYGRRQNLDSLLLQGNGQITMKDAASGKVIYRHSFSTLFQEWQTTEEAARTRKSFENVFLVPFPKAKAEVTVTLSDTHNRVTSTLSHTVDPEDILIRHIGQKQQTPWKYVHQGGDPQQAIDVAILAEGYAEGDMEMFWKDCQETADAFLKHEPFASLADRFNFIAVFSPSKESGISVPHANQWFDTALGSHFDTFYSDRYLTTLKLKKVHDALAGIPYEHIIILANTETYGGGGIYNSYTLSAAHNASARPVVVHEFGHSFGGLADEYYYDDQYETQYPTDTEPWEPNLTTLVNFESKWKDMLTEKQLKQIPTKPDGKDIYTKVGVYEGGGYVSKGVYRPVQECRMKVNNAPSFCPVCERAIRRLVDYYTK